jgi:hypothetical protein
VKETLEERVDDLTIFAINTGEIYPERQEAIAAMKRRYSNVSGATRKSIINLGTRLYVAWYRRAAGMYYRTCPETRTFSQRVILAAARAQAADDYGRIVNGEF